MVRVGWTLPSDSSLLMPSSDVNRPSVLLDPEPRGFLTSGSVIFMRFAGLSIVGSVQGECMRVRMDQGGGRGMIPIYYGEITLSKSVLSRFQSPDVQDVACNCVVFSSEPAFVDERQGEGFSRDVVFLWYTAV